MRVSIVCSVVVALSLGAIVGAEETGRLSGRLVDEKGAPRAEGGVAVVPLEFATGRPLLARTKRPLASGDDPGRPKDLLHAVTDSRGEFRFPDLPIGTYRLLAQSWPGAEGMPDDWECGDVVVLHGAAEEAKVGMGQAQVATVKAFGDATMTFENDPAEGGAFLLLSRRPTLGDPILGYDGWTPDFLRGLLAVTHMGEPKATVIGLPRDATIHASLFAYDNSPGVGGGEFSTASKEPAVLKIYAGWSDGHDEAPTRLTPLVEWIERTRPDVPTLYPFLPFTAYRDRRGFGEGVDLERLRQAVLEEPLVRVDLGEAGEWLAVDILAATSYADLREHHRDRREAGENAPVGAVPDAVQDAATP